MLDCNKVKTFTPFLPAGQGPTLTNIYDCMEEIVSDLNEQNLVETFNSDELRKISRFLSDSLDIVNWIDGKYTLFDDYHIEIKVMQQWQLDQMPEFTGY